MGAMILYVVRQHIAGCLTILACIAWIILIPHTGAWPYHVHRTLNASEQVMLACSTLGGGVMAVFGLYVDRCVWLLRNMDWDAVKQEE